MKYGAGERCRKPVGSNVRKNEALLRAVKDEGHILHTGKRRQANWIGHILCRNCLLKHVVEGKVEGRTELTRI